MNGEHVPAGETDMSIIKASCPGCGDVEITPAQVWLVVCTVPSWTHYAFECPGCVEEVRKHASDEVVALLRDAGVVPDQWVVPAEALEQHTGAPISWDDVLDFTVALYAVQDLAGAAAWALHRHLYVPPASATETAA